MPRKKKNQLPSGNVRIQVYAGRDPATGKRMYKSFTAGTKAEAQAMARRWQLTREDPEPPKPKVPTLAEAMDAFIDTCRAQDYSPSTIPGYLAIRRHSFPSLLERPVDQITVPDIQAALDARSEDHSVKTVRNDFYFLKKVLALHAPALDLRQITLAKRKKPKKRTFKQRWAAEILEASRYDPEFHLYCCLIVSASLRPSESFALTWGDLSPKPMNMILNGHVFRYGEIHVSKAAVLNEFNKYEGKDPKTEAGDRFVTVDWSFFEHFYSVIPRGRADERIFRLKPNQVDDRWKKLRAALDLPSDFRFYDLRHFFATAMVRAGATEEELQSAMGHATADFTHRVYVEIFEESQQRVNAAMAEETRKLFG